MPSTFLLIRHATNHLVGQALAGRKPGVRLNEQGVAQADALARRLSGARIDALYSSPLDRTLETAKPVAQACALRIQIAAELIEVDFGDWTGRSFEDLRDDPQWPLWCSRRSEARPPGGESIVEVQRRVMGLLYTLRERHENETVAVVSHGDVIKSALAGFLHSSLDALEAFEIAPASVSVVTVGSDWSQVKAINDTGALPLP